MSYPTVTVNDLEIIADHIADFAHRVRRIADDAIDSEITPEQATQRLNEVLSMLEDYAQVNQTPLK